MSNLSYCRFRNTLKDLGDCLEYINYNCESKEEEEARVDLINMCKSIAQDFFIDLDDKDIEFDEDEYDDPEEYDEEDEEN